MHSLTLKISMQKNGLISSTQAYPCTHVKLILSSLFRSPQSLVNQQMQTNVLKSPSINPLQSPYFLANNNSINHHTSSSTQSGTNNTLAKGPPPTVRYILLKYTR